VLSLARYSADLDSATERRGWTLLDDADALFAVALWVARRASSLPENSETSCVASCSLNSHR